MCWDHHLISVHCAFGVSLGFCAEEVMCTVSQILHMLLHQLVYTDENVMVNVGDMFSRRNFFI